MITKLALSLLLGLAGRTTDTSGKISILLDGAKSYLHTSCSSEFEVTEGETREQIVGEGKSGLILESGQNPATIKVALSFASDDEEAGFKSKVKQGAQILSLAITEKSESASGAPMNFTARVGAARVSKITFGKGSDRTGLLTFTCARMDYSKVAAVQ